MRHRIEAFLYTRRNIAGTLLAIGGLVLHFVGLVTGPLWLPIVLGLYLIGVLLVPAERPLSFKLDASQDSVEIRRGLERLVSSLRGRVSDDIRVKVESIRDSILVTLPDAGEGVDAGDPNVYLIRQTALDYLPRALETYLALPRLYADRRLAGGRTPHDVLLEQLDLMDRKMQEAAEAIVRHDSDRLLANGRFLAERFASSSLRIDPSADAVAASSTATPAATAEAAPSPAEQQERVH